MNYFLENAKKNWNFKYSFEEELTLDKLTLSPSDFGFHNSIKNNNNELCFIDFEYFGYDDPVKLISDFYYHPGMNLNSIQKEYWLKQTLTIFGEEVYLRANLCKPLYGLIWCLIILNDFRPEILERRISATTEHNLNKSSLLQNQLNKARSLLNYIKQENNNLSYE
jgi:thiamine kinase-like enzyme